MVMSVSGYGNYYQAHGFMKGQVASNSDISPMPSGPGEARDVGLTAPSPYPTERGRTFGTPESVQSHRYCHFSNVLGSSRKYSAGKTVEQSDSDRAHADAMTVPVPAFTRWFHPDCPGDTAKPASARSPLQIAPHQRILFSGGGTPQARIHIATGNLAGSEIHLALTGTNLVARLLTRNEASRQMLVAAMDVVREKLRARAIAATSNLTSTSDTGHQARHGARQPAP
jgi:hypothetical protein